MSILGIKWYFPALLLELLQVTVAATGVALERTVAWVIWGLTWLLAILDMNASRWVLA